MNENVLLKWALWYRNKMGFSVIPIKEFPEAGELKKRPYIKWEQYQKEKADNEQITKWWTEHPKAMIGIVTGVISGISVVDADIYKMTDAEKVAFKTRFSSIPTPTAYSPKKGEHYYFKYNAQLPQRAEIEKNVDGRNNGGYIVAPPSASNGHGQYAWDANLKIGKTPLQHIPEGWLRNFITYLDTTRGGDYKGGGFSGSDISNATHAIHTEYIEEGNRDQELFHLANLLFKGGADEVEVIKYITLFAKRCCAPAFPEKDIFEKVKSALKRKNTRGRNIAEEVRNWVLLTSGHFLLTNLSHELTLHTSQERNAAAMALKRLCEQGVIEKVGERRGSYRLVERDIEKIDLKAKMQELSDSKFKGLHVSYPFGLERFIWTYPKTVIVLAGSKGSGKTAFALNFAMLNQKKHRVIYFNSEMGEDEFASRLLGFEDIRLDEWNIEPYVRMQNFQDVIEPDAVNIVDFLEKEDNFWTIGADIRRIWEKLKSGIALVLIQKESRAERGRGGDFSREKARLYLTLDYDTDRGDNTLKIVDAKNWRNPEINPRGQYINFKLFKGVNYTKVGPWREPL